MKLLTVTVPCYNSQEYMEKCVDSLLLGGDRMEIIIIDDGSKDNTGAIADSYAQRYPQIVRVIHQENGGHGEGINQGLMNATGTYFKVVDSDDCLSADLPAFLDMLEECERQGGADMVLTNYYYVHSDGVGDRSINYSDVMEPGKILTWSEIKPFKLHQMMSIHSSTFRTEAMRDGWRPLPKHTFYEDNLMVQQGLVNAKRLCYMNADLYLYTIGREGQSVQDDIIRKRYDHQIRSSQACFTTCHLDDIPEPQKKKYFKHALFMLLAFAIVFARLNNTEKADQDLEAMWDACYDYDPAWANHFRNRTALWFLCIPGPFGRWMVRTIHGIARKVVRFN